MAAIKDLKNAVCFPDMDSSREDKDQAIKVLDKRIEDIGREIKAQERLEKSETLIPAN